jgi:50S ribosomal protein L16 3-hydroxylase
MDDLMVSFSNKNAGVGSHLDQYDVFIIQGKGSRRWQVGLPGNFEAISPHKDLSQITGFEPVINEILMPGDIIYIPANHPHNGTALEDCLNYSVGFRAPSQQEMLSSLADFAIDNNLFTVRYTDKEIIAREFSGEITQQEIARFKQMLHQLLETDQFSNWTAQFLSQGDQNQEYDEQDTDNFEPQEIAEKLKVGVQFIRCPGIKPVFVEQQPYSIQDFTFYVRGEAFSVPLIDKDLVTDFLNKAIFCLKDTNLPESSVCFAQLVTKLVNSGYWYPERL